jgi:16S rRNA processing protein RimM
MTPRKPPPAKPEGGAAERAPRICLGIVAGAHGVEGAVRLKSFAEAPEDIARYGRLEDESGARHFGVRVLGQGKGVVIARLSGIADRDQAEALRGARLYLPRAALPPPGEEEYYHADLIGLAAESADGTHLGEVCAVYDFGAGDVLELAREGAPPVLVPFTRAVVPVVDLARRRLVLDPPPGLLDAAGEREPEP